MERAAAAEILAGLLQGDVFANNPNNVGLLFHSFGDRSSFCHFLRTQFYNGDGSSSVVFGSEGMFFHKGM